MSPFEKTRPTHAVSGRPSSRYDRGALFSSADCHATEGDGEVRVTGIEAPMFVTARFGVRTDMDIQQPHLETAVIGAGAPA